MPTDSKQINVEFIQVDYELQQRPIDDDTVRQYAAAMIEGDIFPAIELVCDGKDYWLFDGFHRVHAARQAGRKEIIANVHEGTRRDALYLSFGVNSKHGLPRPRGSLKRILIKILTDSEWSRKPLREIARHVNCDPKYVRMTRDELEDGDSPQPLQRADKIIVQTCDGKEYERPSSCRKNEPARTISILTQTISRLSEIETGKKVCAEIKLAIEKLEAAKSIILKRGK